MDFPKTDKGMEDTLSSESLLKVSDLSVHYGLIHAVQGVSLEIRKGEICCLIGANGAGKSTILKAISGLKRVSSGRITFLGEEITNLPAHKIISRGISYVPEGRRPFANLTVYENLRLGAYLLRDKKEFTSRLDWIFKSFPRLRERLNQLAGTLSGGELQMLALARGLISRPKLLLLDEPSMGLSPILVGETFSIIKEIQRRGISILLVEQNAYMALSCANRAYVLENGKIVLSGEGKDLLSSPALRSCYL
jgi:branched-chain amino acid transport system ATP-binding protein